MISARVAVLNAQPFDCDNGQRLYFFRENGGNGTLSYIQNYTTTPSVVNLCNLPTPNHNGLAGNPLDGYLYYQNGNTLLRLSSNCTVTPVCQLPFASNLGAFDPLGRYWTLDGTNLVAIDISTCSIVKGPYPVSLTGIVDLAFNPYDCYLYIGDQRFDTTGVVDPTYIAPPLNQFGGGFVGAAVGSNGNIYTINQPGFFSNSSTLVSINPNTGVATQVGTINPGSPLFGGGDMGSFPCFDMEADFNFNITGCQPVTVSFTDSTSGPTGTWTYQWDFGDPASGAANTSTSINATHTYSTQGTYQVRLIVTLTTTSYCLGGFYQDTIIKTIVIPPGFTTSNVSSLNATCFGLNNGSATVTPQTGTPPFSYQWSPSGGSAATATGLAPGNYTVIVTDSRGCTGVLPVTIGQPPALAQVGPSITANVTCAGGNNGSASVTMTGGTPPYTYQWSAGTPNGSSVSGLPAGTHQVVVTDFRGCTYTATVTITEPPPLQINIVPPAPICQGMTVNLNAVVQGGVGPYQYLWSGGSTGSGLTVTPSATTTYTLTVTDANGCSPATGPVSVTVTVLPTTIPISAQVSYVCAGQTAVLNAAAGMSNYVWTNLVNGNSIVVGNNSTLTVNPVNLTNYYTVSYTSPNGCIGYENFEVGVNNFTLAPISPVAICAGSTTTLTGPAGLSAYVWSPATGLSTNGIANPQVTPSSTTTYTLIATNAAGCTDTTTAIVTVNNVVLTATPSASVCNGYSASLQATPGLASYIWTPAAGLSASNVANPIASPASSTTYTVIATDINGCTATATSTVTVNGLTITATPTVAICEGYSTGLATTPGLAAYSWSPATGLDSTNVASPIANPTSTTTYTIIATDANGCTGTATTTVVVNSLNIATSPSVAICNGTSANLGVTPGLSAYTWSPAVNLSSSTISNPVATPAATTTYTVIATDANGCIDSASTTVTVNELQLIAPVNPSICIGYSTQLNSNPGLASYNWSPAAGLSATNISNPLASLNATTTYTLIATDANGCTDTESYTVTVGNPVVTANAPAAICIGDTLQLSATPGFASYSWSPAASLNSGSISGPAANPSTTTTYTVIATASGGCTATATTTVTVNSLTLSAIPGIAVCLGDAGTLNADAGLSAYDWTPSTGLNTANISNPTAAPTATTQYTLVATDFNGCKDTVTTTVTVNELQLPAAVNPNICIGYSTTLNTTPGLASYSWSPAAGLNATNIANPVAGPASTTTYTLIATDANGCSDTENYTVSVGNPIVTANAPGAICIGSSMPLSATPGFVSYAWSPAVGLSSGNISNPQASPSATTTYTVTATSPGGCTATATTTVTVNSLNLSAIPSSSICLGFSTNLNADAGLTDYNWVPSTGLSSTNIANPAANPTSTTQYTVTATDINGCTDAVTTTVVVNQLQLPAAVNPDICINYAAILNTTPGLTSYNWSPAAGLSATNIANPIASPVSTTTYTLVATDANGCTDTENYTVSVSNPIVTVNPSAAICSGFSTPLSASPGFASYSWSPQAGLNNVNISAPVAGPPVTTAYTVTATGADGCTATATTTVTVNSLSLSAVQSAAICLGGTTTLNADPGLVSYNWNPTTGLNSATVFNPVAAPVVTTTYNLTATDANGCTASTSATVTVNQLTLTPIPNQAICIGTPTVINADPGLSIYSWSPVVGLSNPSSGTTVASPAATTTYTLNATDANGCTASTSTTITVNSLNINVSSDTAICIGNAASLSVTPGLTTYVWTPGIGLSNPLASGTIASPAVSTTYSITATDANGCSDTDSIRITVNSLNLIAGPDTGICPGETVQLYSTQGLTTYRWTPSTGLSANNIFNPVAGPAQTKTYTLTATDINGCTDTQNVTIKVFDQPRAQFTFSPENPSDFNPQVYFNDMSFGATQWLWSFGDGNMSNISNPMHIYDSAGVYTIYLTVSNDEGCTDSILKTIEVISDFALWLPNGFSPNEDGLNDFYRADGFNIEFIEMAVYNRFGERIFYTNRFEEGWNGIYLDQPSQVGTYICQLRYRDPKKNPKEITKYFSLIR